MNIKKNGKVSGKVLKQEKLGKSEELKGSLSKYGDKGRDCCKMSSPSDPPVPSGTGIWVMSHCF